jgi:hypothetical protein
VRRNHITCRAVPHPDMNTPADRIRKALETRDAAELQWSLDHARARVDSAPDENIARYWKKVVERIEEAAPSETPERS